MLHSPVMNLSFESVAFPRWRSVLGVLVILVIGGYFYLGQGTSSGATFTISPGDFRKQVSVSGTIIAAQNVELGFATNGRIALTYARVGQRVAAGTILAETENGDLVATLSQKRAALAQARANLASLQAGTRPEELAIASASVASAAAALVDALRSAYTASDDAVHNKLDAFFTNPRTDPKLSFSISNANLKTTLERGRSAIEPAFAAWTLLTAALTNARAADSAGQAQTYLAQVATLLADANTAINQGLPDPTTSSAALSSYASTLATGRTNVNSAATLLTSAAAALDAARNTLILKQAGSTSETVAAQAAAVAAAAADVENARAALNKTYVTAPFAGIVTRMDAKVGETVSPTTSLISVQSDGIFQIETYVPETAIAGIAAGNSATTTLDAYGSSVALPATVVAVDPAETMNNGVPAYKTTLSLCRSDLHSCCAGLTCTILTANPTIRSGMTANVIITTGVLHNAIVIPNGAMGNKNGVPYVSVLVNGKAVKRTVRTGPSPALGQTEIISGLSEGDVILLSPSP